MTRPPLPDRSRRVDRGVVALVALATVAGVLGRAQSAAVVAGAVMVAAAVSALLIAWRLLAQLDRERRRQAAILASIVEGCVVTDAEGRIIEINPAMERLSGWENHEVAGRRYTEIFRTFDVQGEAVTPLDERLLTRAIRYKEAARSTGYEMTLLSRDGRRVPVAVAAGPIFGEDGRAVGGVATMRDVTHEREVDDLKSSLISIVSHELRTPLTAIRGFLMLLLRADVDESTRAMAGTHATHSVQRMQRLVEDLLSVAAVESDEAELHLETVCLIEAVREAVGAIHRPDRRVDIEVREGVAVRADPDRLHQVLVNLLSNALKYSPEHEPVIVSVGQTDAEIEIAVKDLGIGMAPEELDQLFEKFFRSPNPEVRRKKGSGLGLYICKQLVELMDGQIWVTSRPGEGTTVTFTLPAVPAEQVLGSA